MYYNILLTWTKPSFKGLGRTQHCIGQYWVQGWMGFAAGWNLPQEGVAVKSGSDASAEVCCTQNPQNLG